jgi:hypothetical protein
MKKLRLNVDALKVETFDTIRTGQMRGTVAAHNDTLETCEGPDSLDKPTCMGYPQATCHYQCTYQGPTCE